MDNTVNVSAIQAVQQQKGESKENSSKKSPEARSLLGALNIQQSPDKMVKKANMNNMAPGRFGGDDP